MECQHRGTIRLNKDGTTDCMSCDAKDIYEANKFLIEAAQAYIEKNRIDFRDADIALIVARFCRQQILEDRDNEQRV
jgi:hypothetical protein